MLGQQKNLEDWILETRSCPSMAPVWLDFLSPLARASSRCTALHVLMGIYFNVCIFSIDKLSFAHVKLQLIFFSVVILSLDSLLHQALSTNWSNDVKLWTYFLSWGVPYSPGAEEPVQDQAEHCEMPTSHHCAHQKARPEIPVGLQRAEWHCGYLLKGILQYLST